MATCKQFRGPDYEGYPDWESWLPDGRAVMDFKSNRHREAVENTLTRDLWLGYECSNFPAGTSKSGIHDLRYLRVECNDPDIAEEEDPGVTFFAEPWAVDSWVDYDFKQHDHVWIPCVEEDGWEEVPSSLQIRTIDFSLAPARTSASFRRKSVYRLQSCFFFTIGRRLTQLARPSIK